MSAAIRTALVPVVKTQFYPRITRSGLTRPECWEARTEDDLWQFEREDSPGTPWLVYSLPRIADDSYALPVAVLSSLRACRACVASGQAQADLDRLLAHERGEHAERDPSCRRC